MRIVAALAVLVLLATPAPLSVYAPLPVPAEPWVEFTPLPLADPSWSTGPLTYAGGWMLASNHPRFGGLSALHADGSVLLALSDRGFAFRFGVPTGRAVRAPLAVGRLADGPAERGKPLGRDSESLVVAGSSAWVGFERSNAIWRYRLPNWEGAGGRQPPAMRHWPDNGGAEAMLRLRDGRFLVLSEAADRGKGTEALLFGGDPVQEDQEPIRLVYRAPAGFRLTDAAQLSDGRLLFINRRVSLLLRFTAVLTMAGLPKLGEDVEMSGEIVARFEPPAPADNMEALAVTHENGRDTIWVASDDNFSPLQRTLLLKFVLSP